MLIPKGKVPENPQPSLIPKHSEMYAIPEAPLMIPFPKDRKSLAAKRRPCWPE